MKLNALKKARLTQPGKRVNQSSTPQLLVKSTYNQFTLNDKARELLGVRVKEDVDDMYNRVYLWDPAGETDPDTGMRFFLFRGFHDEKGDVQGAKLGNTYGFTFSPLWGAMNIANPALGENTQEVSEVSIADMERFGIFADADSKIAAYKASYDVVPVYVDGEELVLTETDTPYLINTFGEEEAPIFDANGDETEVQVYALVNVVYRSHDPKVSSDDDEVEEIEEEVED